MQWYEEKNFILNIYFSKKDHCPINKINMLCFQFVLQKTSYIQRNHFFTISGYITEKQQPYNLFLPHFCTTAVSVMTTTVCGHYLFSL